MFSALLVTGELVVVVVVAAYRAALSSELGLSSSVFARRSLAEDPRIDRATAIVNLPYVRTPRAHSPFPWGSMLARREHRGAPRARAIALS